MRISLPARSALRVLGGLALAVAFTAVPAASARAEEAAAGAPATRRESWQRLRHAKLAALRPPQRSFLERTLLDIEKAERPNLAAWNLAGLYPRSGSIGWGSQLALGARLWHPDIGDSTFDVHGAAFYSVRHYQSYELQAGWLPHRGRRLPRHSTPGDGAFEFANELRRGQGRWLGYAGLRYHDLPEVDFYGLGNESRPEDRTTFLLQDALYDLVVAFYPRERAALMARGGFLRASVGPGRDDDVPSLEQVFPGVPGFAEQPDFAYVTGVAALDLRDEPGNPHLGALFALTASHFDDGASDAFRFDRLSLDARGFLPLGSTQRVLAVRAVASTDRPATGAQVPFFLQQTLGGSHTLRGYPNFRFRGERLLLLQAEYRWEANPALELALFVDSGRVSPHTEEWSLEDLHTSYGAGVRIKTFDAVRFRFDVAKSPETTRFLVRLGPSF